MKGARGRNLNLGQKLILLFSIPLFLQLLFTLVIAGLLERMEQLAEHEFRSKEVLGQTNWMYFLLTAYAFSWSAYELTGDKEHKANFEFCEKKLPESVLKTSDLLKNDAQKDNAKKLEEISKSVQEEIKSADNLGETADKHELVKNVLQSGALKSFLLDFAEVRHQLLSLERNNFKVGAEGLKPVRDSLKGFVYFSVCANLIAGCAAVFIYGIAVGKRLSKLTDNAERLAKDEELLPEQGGYDELSLLDSTFHEMAATLKEAAEKERAIIKNAVDLICSLDKSLNFVSANPSTLSAIDLVLDPTTKTNLLSFVETADKPAVEKAARQTFDELIPHDFECRLKRKDATIGDYLWSMRWVSEQSLYFCVAHNITDRKHAEKLREEMIQMVSHDIRTPLTTLQISLEMIDKAAHDTLPEQSVKMLDRARLSCRNMISLANDLLEMQKLEAGMMELDLGIVPLDDLFDQAQSLVSGNASKMNVTVQIAPLDIEVYADARRVEQVIVNLLGNAIKFSPRDSVVTLSAEAKYGEVTISVKDNGRGVPAELRSKIFDRFSQVEARDASQHKGAGLGLAISKALVELHGGKIWCTSEKGKGSNFLFTLKQYKG